MRLCLVTGSHPVDYTRFYDREAASLAAAGHEVHLIGLEPRRPPVPLAGITLTTLPRRQRLGKRHTVRDIERVVARLHPDACHCFDLWSLAAGLRLKQRGLCRLLVYDSTEDFPSAFRSRSDLGPLLARVAGIVARQVERQACLNADAIIETNWTRAERFLRCGRSVEVVANFPPAGMLPEPQVNRSPLFAYTGTITRHRGFLVLLDALAIVRRRFPGAGLRVIGDYDPHDDLRTTVEEKLTANGLRGAVSMLGTLSYAAMFDAVGCCMAGVILLQPGRPNDYSGQPNKLFEFMGAGLAVLASNFPEITPIVERERCGLLVDPTDPQAVADAMTAVLAEPSETAAMGQRGRAAVVQRYNWSVAERVLVDLYGSLGC